METRFLAAALLLLPFAGQDIPVVRLADGAAAQSGPAGQAGPAGGLPPVPATQIGGRSTTLDSPRRLTLSFLEPRPIDEVLALLTAGTPFSIAIDADARGSFRGELKQLTLREALSTLLSPLGLDFEVRGTVIRVRRRQLDTRIFDLNLLNVRRGLARTTGSASAGATVESSAAADDVMRGIAEGIRTLLSDGGRVHVDPRAGVAQVTDYPDRLDRVALYVEALHRRSERQVRLQAEVFEVTLNGASSIDWGSVRRQLGLQSSVPQAGFAADPGALRGALVAQGDVRTLWTPEVTTLNNEPALMRVGAAGGTSLTMTVVPQIAADGVVQLSVSHAWEEASLTRKAESDTVMRVMDGNTMMIAGLLRPVAASDVRSAGYAELVVLLRPTVVDAGSFVPVSGKR
jgi:type II secretory pathway component GspD/PulD (secretin)